MTIGSTSLEEWTIFLANIVEALMTPVKEKDEQIAFMMNKITSLTSKRLVTMEQKHDPSLQEKAKNTSKVVKNS